MVSETMHKASEDWHISVLKFSLSSVSPISHLFLHPTLIILIKIKHELIIHRRQRILMERLEKLDSSLNRFSPLKLYNKYYYLPNAGRRV